jgi:serine/threonine-protein kinase
VPAVGSTVGEKYRIDRTIGAGGMGTIFAATHLHLGQPVALKFLSEKIRDSKSNVERFTREAKACAQLKSQHICRVSDFGIQDGLPYIAMELLEGIDLAQLLDRGPLGAETAVDYVLQACVGLAEAHGLGIVHRDLKPSNLFVTKHADGSPLVKVLDFGIAKFPVEGDERALTQTSTVVGSPGYMAPEQLRASKNVDSRADVWALGTILYELISRRHPFHASAVTEIAVKIAMDEPAPLVEAPPELARVVMKCLRKERDGRYRNASELAAALAPFARQGARAAAVAARFLHDGLDNRPTIQQPKPAGLPMANERPPAPPPRERSLGLIAALVVLAIGGAIGFVVVIASRGSKDKDPPPVAVRDEPKAKPSPEPAPIEVPVDAAPKPEIPTDVPPEKPPSAIPSTTQSSNSALAKVEVNEKLMRATAKLQAKGLLSDDVPEIAKLRTTVRKTLANDIALAGVLADRLLSAIEAFQVDEPFIRKKIARIANRIGTLRPPEPTKKELDDLMQEVEKFFNSGDYILANVQLSVAAGILARLPKR